MVYLKLADNQSLLVPEMITSEEGEIRCDIKSRKVLLEGSHGSTCLNILLPCSNYLHLLFLGRYKWPTVHLTSFRAKNAKHPLNVCYQGYTHIWRRKSMAFFNLAHLGPQDPFKAKIKTSECQLPGVQTSTAPKLDENSKLDDKPSSANKSVNTAPSASDAGSIKRTPQNWHNGSHVKYTDNLRKHQRNPNGASGRQCQHSNMHAISSLPPSL